EPDLPAGVEDLLLDQAVVHRGAIIAPATGALQGQTRRRAPGRVSPHLCWRRSHPDDGAGTPALGGAGTLARFASASGGVLAPRRRCESMRALCEPTRPAMT